MRTLLNLIVIFILAAGGFFCARENIGTLISLDRLSLVALSGLHQSAAAGELLPEPLTVRVGLESGKGLPGRSVEIKVISGDGQVLRTSDTTDERGIVSFRWKLGLVVGEQRLSVSSQGVGELLITARALSKPGTLTLVSGEGQRGYQRDTLAVPIVAALLTDSRQPIARRLIVPKVRSGGGIVLPPSASTDANGTASFCWIVGDAEGQQEIELLAGTPSSVRVSATVTRGQADADVTVFDNAMIEYSSGKQTVSTVVSFPTDQYYRIQAELSLRSPCVSCSDADCDPWDRIGSITMEAPSADGQMQTLELIRFITPFGNSNTYVQDLSSYSPLLRGTKTVKAYVSTFLGKWFVTLKLKFRKSTLNAPVTAAFPIFYSQFVSAANGDNTMTIQIPQNRHVQLAFRSTGHNSQGRNCDEFCQKVNEIYVDGMLVKQLVPWRVDCGSMLPLNRCGSTASVALSRAGWCPGDIVRPYLIDLGSLAPGTHTVRVRIVDIEPNGGYWRTSLDASVFR